jgi:uncharacterized membrane protein YeaQ/YmgE (transglycosylase-associated protein family)
MDKKLIISFVVGWLASLIVPPTLLLGIFRGVQNGR